MDDEPGYLQIPITEHEHERVRARQRSRSDASSRLLHPDSESVYSQGFDDTHSGNSSQTPSRFPSVRGESAGPAEQLSAPRRFHSYQGGAQYAAISPIDEEDSNVADAASEAPSGRPRTIPQSELSYSPLVPLPELWTPIWLRRSTLAAFIVFFILSIIILVVLWVLSRTRSGFEIHFTGPHHAYWVYFPTILVIFLVGLWRQVDFHTKSLTPWDELQKGPVQPTKSLLLDYVSSLQIVALFQAFIHNHIPIVATVSAFMFFKIITVFSTGLFILLPQDVEQGGFPLLGTSTFASNVVNLDSITAAPVSAFQGTAYQGIPQAPGVWTDLAYTTFRYDQSRNEKLADNATFTADRDAFVPSITCRIVEIRLDGNKTTEQSPGGDVYGNGVRFAIDNDDICSKWPAVLVQTLNPQKQIAPTSQIFGSIQALTCDSNEPAALLFSLLDVAFEQSLRDGSIQLAIAGDDVATSSSRTVNNMANVLCQASHTIATVTVSNDTLTQDSPTQGVSLELAGEARNRTLEDLSDGALMSAFGGIANVSGNMFGQTPGSDSTSGLFTLLAMHFGRRDTSRLLNADDLMRAIDPTFKGIMAQYAIRAFNGRAVRRETRYWVNEASAAVMIGALLVGVAAAGTLLFRAPRGVVPRNPGPIGANAAVLTNSIELNRLLRRGGIPSKTNSEVAVDGYEFGTAIATTEHGQASFKIVTSEGVHDYNTPAPDKTLRWWHPITSSIFFVIPTVALPILCIGLLEFIQSKNDDGIVGVPDNVATDIYTHYIPALVMVIIASMVNLIDFNIAVFTPWSALSKGAATHKKSILAYYLGITPLEAAFRGFRVRQFNIVISTLATVVASILTIVAAGLYNGDRFRTEGTTINLVQSDSFNLRWTNSSFSDNGAAGVLNSVIHDNLTYPEFTYRNVVLPSFSLEDGDLSTTNGTTRDTAKNLTEVTVDALLPDLRCYLVDRNFITVTSADSNVDVNVQATLPDECQIAGVGGDASFVSFDTTFEVPSNGTLIGGRQFDLLFGDGGSLVNNVLQSDQLNLSSLISDNPAIGCPSLAFVYGSFSASAEDATDITAMLCWQQVMSVRSTFNLVSNTTLIDAKRGVTVDQSDAKFFVNPVTDATGSTRDDEKDPDTIFNFRIQGNLARSFRPFRDTPNDDTRDLDPFFQGVLHADPSTTIQASTLIGEDNQSDLLTAILNFYRLYMAQAISLNMRSALSASSLSARQDAAPLATIPTTLTSIRLVQDKTTKLILQILLALTSTLTLAAWLLTRFRRVLPLNPLSTANHMSLLAGSDLAHTEEADDDQGLCECCGKPRSKPHSDAVSMVEDAASSRGRPTSSRSDAARLSVPPGLEFDQRTSSPRGSRDGVVPVGAEWWGAEAGSGTRIPVLGRGKAALTKEGKGKWEVVFAGRRYSMGWWKDNPARGRMRRRFGVDVGERADGDEDDWMLGRRRLRNSTEGSVGMRFDGSTSPNRGGLSNTTTQSRSLGEEAAPYEGRGYGPGLQPPQDPTHRYYDPHQNSSIRPRPSSDLGYSTQRQNITSLTSSIDNNNQYTYTGPSATPSQPTGGTAAGVPWSLGARRLRTAGENVTPSMRFEAPTPTDYIPMSRGGRALDAPPELSPALMAGGYGEGGLRNEGIASSDRGDGSEQEESEDEWGGSDEGDGDLGDMGRGSGRGTGGAGGGVNFSRPGGGYQRVGGGGGEA
ncbi:uncharacterized protein AB675_4315 [Cyphellophora attinorum]|uniref:Uncharacterized protein n=1 Tax=Cyphellophora attinorum TaxID=1664694 RepID=A0A0N1HRL6_9EURO|nr:uncharacterized protein AB675_4315 [Phialophora attinorum]KPI38474.1 hypothetical protein AB675_4315 [Phialophora attinorum]